MPATGILMAADRRETIGQEASHLWTVIDVAPSMEAAERLQAILGSEGILASLRSTGLSTNRTGSHVELLVPRGEAREAHEVLNQALVRMRQGRQGDGER